MTTPASADEKAGNAQLAREIDAALPIELSREEQIRLVREYYGNDNPGAKSQGMKHLMAK